MKLRKDNHLRRSLTISLGAVATVLGTAAALVAQSGVLQDIKVANSPSGTEVRVILTVGVAPKVLELASPTRLVLDLPGIGTSTARPEIEVGAGGILRVRTGMFSKDTARIVFDMAGKIPRYEIVKTVEGLKVVFAAAPGGPPVVEEQAKVPPAKEEAAKPVAQEKPPAVAVNQEQAKPVEKPEAVDRRKEEEARQAKLDQARHEAKPSLVEEPTGPARTYRAMVTVGPYFPNASALKDRYGIGVKVGAELNGRIADHFEIWVSASLRSQSAIDPATAQERSFSLLPVLVGLNYRPIEGFVNPYLGFGAGYYIFSETFGGEISHELEFGLEGRAGVFLKLSRAFVLGLQAQFDHCRMVSNSARVDPGGFHIALTAGMEF